MNQNFLTKEFFNKFNFVNFIHGKLQKPSAGKSFELFNPAKMEKIFSCPASSEKDVNMAVDSAEIAQKEWAKVEIRQRGEILQKIAESFQNHAEELAQIVTLETGKAIRTESRIEASVFWDIFKFYAGLGPEIKGEEFPLSSQMLSYTHLEPIGVVGAIIPWNVPLMMFALKVAPALLAGNGVVVKPSEEAPIAILRAAEILSEFVPSGLVNVVLGAGEAGEILVRHAKIKKISFTGSVATGRKVAENAARKIIPATLELGGKSPMIISKNADLERAARGFISGMRFTRQGQSCSAASMVFVQEEIFDDFFARIKGKLDALKIGDPFSEETDVGSVISLRQFEKISEYVAIGKKDGICHEFSEIPAVLQNLPFCRPTIFTDISRDSRLSREEIFGPVACFFKFRDFEDAIEMANDSDFGLTATIWTENLKEAMCVERLEAGLVQVNQNLVVQSGIPYGGHKNSGLGVEASISTVKEHFMRSKTVLINRG